MAEDAVRNKIFEYKAVSAFARSTSTPIVSANIVAQLSRRAGDMALL